MAVYQASLDTVDGVPANDMTRLFQLYLRELGCLFKQGIRGNLQSRGDGAAQVFGLLGNGAESRRRTEVDDDQRAAVFGVGCHRVDDSVCSYLFRVVVFHDQSCLDSCSDHDRFSVEVLYRQMLQGIQHRWYDGRYNDVFYLADIQVFILEKLVDNHTVFICTLVVVRFKSPVGDHLSVLEQSQNDVCVSNIKCQ